MNKKYKVITLCGSTKFKDEFLKVQKDLTLKGNIVISTINKINSLIAFNKKYRYCWVVKIKLIMQL